MSDPFGPYALPGFRATMPPFPPGGYATLVSGTPVITSDQASKTVVYYTQDTHNAFPIIKNGTRHAVYFDEPRLVLSSAHAISSIYDVFGVERDGKGHIVSGPVWTTGGGSITAGSCARGTGGGSTELARVGGALVNRWSIAGLNGDGSQHIAPGEGCYLFSIFIDGSAGQITCHRAFGQSRKWGLWNAHNKKPTALLMGDPTASWTYSTATVRQSNGAAGNTLALFCGLAEELVSVRFSQTVGPGNTDATTPEIGIGWNSTTAYAGKRGHMANGSADGLTFDLHSAYASVPFLGINNVNALEKAGPGICTFSGGNASMQMTARWHG